MNEPALLVALIAGLLLPPVAVAQVPSDRWDCQAEAPQDWSCQPAAAGADTLILAETTPATAPPPPGPASETPQIATPAAPITALPLRSATATEDDTRWSLCRTRTRPAEAAAAVPPADFPGIELSADLAEIRQGQHYRLSGDAVVERAGQRIQADQIDYDDAKKEVSAEGAVRIDGGALRVQGSAAHLQLDTEQGDIQDVRYEVYAQHARGQAASVRQVNASEKRFSEATYTTCDEGDEAWRLNADKVTLEQAEGVGRARHVWLELADLPVLYTPYISFPIDDRRKSGLLVPRWGNSDSSGADISLPYYWNIAPHRDATLTPRLLSKRGMQLQTELRYLNPTNSGQLDLEYLPSDQEYGDEDRRLIRLDHAGRPLPRLYTEVVAADVSDDQYFEDLGTDLEISSITHLERRASARYHGDGWSLSGRVQDFQTVDSTIPSTDRPYKRLPQVLFNMTPAARPLGLEFGLESEFVQFVQSDREEGTRLDLTPRLALPLGAAGWFITPAAGLRHTRYELEDRAPGLPTDPDRTTGIASLDSGLLFERSTRLYGRDLQQTLEPRAFYLYVPHKEQDDLPVFDTDERDFSFQQLFEENRFSGADRMGDANQLTLAVTSRLLDPSRGQQLASFSLGEIFYFRDREVTLPGTVPAEESASDLVGEVDLRLTSSWKFIAGMQWDPFESKTERGNVRLQYRPDVQHLWNFAYRYRSSELEQIDTSALWYFSPRWHGVMRWNYSLADRGLLEGLAGLEYESCCWILRLMGRSYVNDTEGERNDAILVQLELKGLTSFGDPIESLVEDGILGYTRNR